VDLGHCVAGNGKGKGRERWRRLTGRRWRSEALQGSLASVHWFSRAGDAIAKAQFLFSYVCLFCWRKLKLQNMPLGILVFADRCPPYPNAENDRKLHTEACLGFKP
jgi:hypothetical protein